MLPGGVGGVRLTQQIGDHGRHTSGRTRRDPGGAARATRVTVEPQPTATPVVPAPSRWKERAP
jgi:hypothetical protein